MPYVLGLSGCTSLQIAAETVRVVRLALIQNGGLFSQNERVCLLILHSQGITTAFCDTFIRMRLWPVQGRRDGRRLRRRLWAPFWVCAQKYMKGMHHAWYIAQQGKYEIEPKLAAQTDGTKHTKRWQYSSKDHLHGTRNHGSHGAFLSEGRCRTSRLIPDSPLAFSSLEVQILYQSAWLPQAPHPRKA
jgi:hypothetical protein